MRDVAVAAGVSVATVSRVLSGGRRHVNPDAAARVRAAAERLGYRTNQVARALRTRSTQSIGMVVPDIANPFFPGLVQSVERELRGRDMSLLLCESGNDVAEEADRLGNLLDHQVSGILITPCDRNDSRQAVRLIAEKVPLVQLDRRALGTHCYVGTDHDTAIHAVIEHLCDVGCTRFAYISSGTTVSTAAERLQAFLRYATPVDPDAGRRVHVGEFSAGWGYQAASRIVAGHRLPHAIVCANDLIAIGALRALREAGVKVPADIAVTGFDDTLLSTASQPQLTTVRQRVDEIGHAAVDLLVALIAHTATGGRTLTFPADLVVRESTGHRPGNAAPCPMALPDSKEAQVSS